MPRQPQIRNVVRFELWLSTRRHSDNLEAVPSTDLGRWIYLACVEILEYHLEFRRDSSSAEIGGNPASGFGEAALAIMQPLEMGCHLRLSTQTSELRELVERNEIRRLPDFNKSGAANSHRFDICWGILHPSDDLDLGSRCCPLAF